ncbi:MAG: helix-turn-helix domain-containing protein [Chlamydiae bacterium CG10_big_fil_rev_8_21_14_0_10_35_9]|nr:MAG: helix-turn-helix domain-containing protein [Chlamydiae bacterium CG10_big_fil_rev_8_21_14_0_10_35_9]
MAEEDTQKLGSLFRTKREEMNLTLKEVENATSIRMMYLQSIEEGKAQQVLSPVYSLGFIRQYASFLGFNPDQLLKDYPEAFKIKKEKQEFDYGIGTLESRNMQGAKKGVLPNLIWGGAVVVILMAAWYFAKFLGVF